ncbi:MAG: Mrp/NBP35 family ATP-binding protein [Roseibium sp.]|nr:Mrp/NBP35 family ATP-binding protein [Roseibium sp.]
MTLTRETVLGVLNAIQDPSTGESIASSGMMRSLQVNGGSIRIVLEIDPDRIADMEALQAEAEQKLSELDGSEDVQIILTAHSSQPAPQKKPSEPQPIKQKPAPPGTSGPQKVPGIDRVIAVASGKGGVGKSTVAANLACALAAQGRKVGLLDADVYGPSQPKMLGISGRPTSPDGQMILPLRNHGVTLISIGLMTSGDQAVVWRGPMLMGALQQMMSQVQWGALDVLIVDLPPGTGDVQMTLSQKFVVDGAIIVSTPQDVALLDARKGIDMFQQMNIPILGMIENMSTHICSKCGHEEHVFGHGGVAAEAEKLGVPLLAEVPLHLNIRLAADGGTPITVKSPDAPEASVFQDLANSLVEGGHA